MAQYILILWICWDGSKLLACQTVVMPTIYHSYETCDKIGLNPEHSGGGIVDSWRCQRIK